MDPYEQQFVKSRATGLPAQSSAPTKSRTDDEIAADITEKVLSDPKVVSQFGDYKTQMEGILGLLAGGGESSADKLAREKFEFEKAKYLAGSGTDSLARQKYADEQAKERRIIEAYQNRLSGGGYRAGADRLLGLIGQQGDVSRGNVEQGYRDALANIAAGFSDAERLTGEGYSALEQAAAQQGAAGFQNLLNTLGASAQQSDASRLAEMMMARNVAQTSLGSQRAGLQSQAARAQADALAQIQAQLAQARLEQETAAEGYRRDIEDAIAAAGGRIPDAKGEGESASRPVDQLAAKASTVKDKKLAARIEAFVKANPNAGISKISKEFPSLAKNLK
jgi:hypothetical protein